MIVSGDLLVPKKKGSIFQDLIGNHDMEPAGIDQLSGSGAIARNL